MTDLVRIVAHKTDRNIVVLKCRSALNDRLRLFEPAQLDPDAGGYLIHLDHYEAFERFAAYTGFYVIDERALTMAQAQRAQLCGVCNLTERNCQASAGNRGALKDHAYTPQGQTRL